MPRKTLLVGFTLLVGAGYAGPAHSRDAYPQLRLTQAAPDNTGRNVCDRSGETLTPGDQSANEADVALTPRIRQAIVADDTLSTTAKNIKIITLNSMVTLRGPVQSEQERTKIAATAQQLAGANKVQNQLEIAGR
jgi:hyperosmotically inducible protein